MDELQEILARIGEDDAPTDEELTTARGEAVNLLNAALDGDEPDLEAGRLFRQVIDDIDSELQARGEAREQQAAEAAQLREGITTLDSDDDEEEAEASDEDSDDDEDDEPTTEDSDEEETAERVAASLGSAVRRTRSRITAQEEPEPSTDTTATTVGPAANYRLPTEANMRHVAEAFRHGSPSVTRGSAKTTLVRLETSFPEERQLGLQPEQNTRVLDAVTSPSAIVASGGVCEPLPVDRTHPVCGDRGRPIRDALPGFNVTGGGVRFGPTATVDDLSDAVSVWTQNVDESPGSLTKPCPHITCAPEEEARVDAITRCLEVGNFQARFSSEFWQQQLDVLMLAWERQAEEYLYAHIADHSTDVTVTAKDGTAPTLFIGLDKAASGIRQRHRLNPTTTLRFIAPSWLRDAIRSDLTAQTTSGTTDTVAVADATIASFFTTRNITPTWSQDLDPFGAQGAGALVDYPGPAHAVLYPEGSFVHLDGGTLDLGTDVTDSTLNQQNNRQAFAESFEGIMFRGCEGYQLEIPVAEDCMCSAA